MGGIWRKREIDAASRDVYERVIWPDHFLRKVEAEVDFSFINGICAQVYHNGTPKGGRPAEEPEILFRALLVMVLYGLPSESSLVRELGVNLAYRWFCQLGISEAIFDHSLLYVLRERLGAELFETILVRIFVQCLEQGLVGHEWAFYDMTAIEAAAAPFSRYEQAVILARAVWRLLEQGPGRNPPADPSQPAGQATDELRAQVIATAKDVTRAKHSRERHIAKALDRLEALGAAPEAAHLPLTERVARELVERQPPSPVGQAQELPHYMSQLLAQLPHARGDADARWGSTRKGHYFCGYLSGILVDGKYRVISGTHLVAGNVAQGAALCASPLPASYRKLTGRAPRQAGLDAGFGYPEVALWLQREWPETQLYLQPHPPPPLSPTQQQVFDGSHFELTDQDQLLCPNPALPPEQRQMKILAHRQDGSFDYQGQACQDCPLRAQCTTKAEGPRVVKLHPAKHRSRLALEAQARTPAHHQAMRQRMATIEPVFGHGKSYHHWGKARYRSHAMNQIFNLLVAIALNVEKLVRYAPLERARRAAAA